MAWHLHKEAEAALKALARANDSDRTYPERVAAQCELDYLLKTMGEQGRHDYYAALQNRRGAKLAE